MKSSWLRRFTTKSPYCKMAPDKDTYVEIVSAIPSIQDNGKQSVNVIGQAEGAEYNYHGYINKEHSKNIYEILLKAQEEKKIVLMRFERMRQKGKNEEDAKRIKEASIDELCSNQKVAKDSVYRVLTGIYNENTNNWILTPNKVSNPEDDPIEVKQWLEKYVLVDDEGVVSADEFFQKPAVSIKKTDTFNEKQMLLTMYFFIMEQEEKNDFSLDEDIRKDLSKKLLKFANIIQNKLTNVDTVVYTDYSHTRARFILFNIIERYKMITKDYDWESFKTKLSQKIKNIIDWIEEKEDF